jgi:L-lactate dehydrogenase complex protein LldF
MRANADLPFASTLCGSCTNVCPVKINIHEQLWSWRQILMKEGFGGSAKKAAMTGMAKVLSSPGLYKKGGKMARVFLRTTPFFAKSKALNPWYKQRELPDAPKYSFNEWYIKNRKNE